MLIRSQNKLSFVNIDNIEKMNIFEYMVTDKKCVWNIEYSTGSKDNLIGRYSTKEKALKVLDMICDNYSENVVKAEKFPELYSINPVFEMPKEEDVIVES